MSISLFISILWATVVLLAYFQFWPIVQKQKLSPLTACLFIASIAFIVRQIPCILLPMGAMYDIDSYRMVGSVILQGGDVYSHPDLVKRYPYLPLQMYWMAFSAWFSEHFQLSFVKVVKQAPIMADVGIAIILFRYFHRSNQTEIALHSGLLYALNPIAILVSAYHGQFDAIPTLCILLAIYWLDRSPLIAGLWQGLGILDKSWPVLAIFSLVKSISGWRKKSYFLSAILTIPLTGVILYIILFPSNIVDVFTRALGYNHGVGVWGYTSIIRMLAVLNPDLKFLFLWFIENGRYLTLGILGLVWIMRARREIPQEGILTILLAFFAGTHAFSIQYLMWLVPFAILSRDVRFLAFYTLGAFGYMLLTYSTLILEPHIYSLFPPQQADWIIILSSFPAWIATIYWLKQRLFRSHKRLSETVKNSLSEQLSPIFNKLDQSRPTEHK